MRLSTRNVSQIHDKKDRFFQIFYFWDITCLYICGIYVISCLKEKKGNYISKYVLV